MNKKNCKIIQDLLPNYIENLTNSETNKFIEEHLIDCEDCKKILEDMKKDIKTNNITEKNDKEVNYIKKINFKMKILKFLVILIVIIILTFAISILRNYIILSKLYKLGDSKINKENYMMIKTFITGDYIGKEINLVKDKKYLHIQTVFFMDDSEREQYMKIYEYKKDGKYYRLSKVIDDDNSSRQSLNEYDFFPNDSNIYTASIYKESFLKELKKSVFMKIRTEDVENIECYAISYENGTYWFEKETGLLIKSTKENTKLYTYYNNCVNDKMVEPPDTTGLEIHKIDN